MFTTPKRFRWGFSNIEVAEKFARDKRETGSRDVVVIPKLNAEDKARGYSFPRIEGADVAWTEETTD